MTSYKGRFIPGTDTYPEMVVRKLIERTGKPFRSQVMVKVNEIDWPYILDFLVDNNKIIEVMGEKWHNRSNTARHKTALKIQRLEDMGYKVMIVWDSDLGRKDLIAETEKKIREFVL